MSGVKSGAAIAATEDGRISTTAREVADLIAAKGLTYNEAHQVLHVVQSLLGKFVVKT